MLRRPAAPSPRVTRTLAVAGALATLAAAVLPWRWNRISGSDFLVELPEDEPVLAVAYLVGAVVAVVVALLLITRRTSPALLWVAAVGTASLLVALLATPLPTGNALGYLPDGRMFEVDVPTHRSWGWYLTAVGAVLVAGSGWLTRRRSARTP